MVQEKKVDNEVLPLDEAIKRKCDSSLMEDGYNPTNVEKSWTQWWE